MMEFTMFINATGFLIQARAPKIRFDPPKVRLYFPLVICHSNLRLSPLNASLLSGAAVGVW